MTDGWRRSVVVAALASTAFGFGLLQSFITPLLPVLEAKYGVGPGAGSWLMTVFLLSASVATPIAGRVGDMFGRARVLRAVMGVFLIGTILAVVASSYEVLLLARFIQGVGGAIFPLAFGIVRETGNHHGVAGGIALISSISAVGSGVGAVVAGPLVGIGGPPSVFFLTAVVVAASGVWVFFVIPVDARASPGNVDLAGASLLLIWLTALLVWISQPSLTTDSTVVAIGLIGAFVLGFTVWALVELRTRHPIVNMRLMLTRTVLLSNALALLFGWLLFANMIAVPAMVQQSVRSGIGFSATPGQSALFVLPQTIMFLAISILASRMDRRPGPRLNIMLGAAFTLAGQTMMWLSHASPTAVVAANAITGIGIGLIYSHLATLVVRTVPETETAAASGMNTNIRNIGGSVGAQVGAAIVASTGAVKGYPTVFAVNAGIAVLALLIAIGIALTIRPSEDR